MKELLQRIYELTLGPVIEALRKLWEMPAEDFLGFLWELWAIFAPFVKFLGIAIVAIALLLFSLYAIGVIAQAIIKLKEIIHNR